MDYKWIQTDNINPSMSLIYSDNAWWNNAVVCVAFSLGPFQLSHLKFLLVIICVFCGGFFLFLFSGKSFRSKWIVGSVDGLVQSVCPFDFVCVCVCRRWLSISTSWSRGWRPWVALNGAWPRCCRAVSDWLVILCYILSPRTKRHTVIQNNNHLLYMHYNTINIISRFCNFFFWKPNRSFNPKEKLWLSGIIETACNTIVVCFGAQVKQTAPCQSQRMKIQRH